MLPKRTLLIAFLVGVGGFLLTWGGWHLYTDHRAHHIIDQQVAIWMQQVQQAQAQQAPPQPIPSPKPEGK